MTIPSEVRASLDAQLAELEAVADPPTGDLGHGTDLSCVFDCRADFGEVEYGTARIVAEAVSRRLVTARGALLDDPDYGFDLRAYLNAGMTQTELRTLHARVQAEVLKDERVESVTLQITVEGNSATIDAMLTPRDPTLAPFSFVLSVTDANAVLDVVNAG